MSASPPHIVLLDEEDAWIWEHEVTRERVKQAEEERQRQREEEVWKMVEAEHVRKEAEAEKV